MFFQWKRPPVTPPLLPEWGGTVGVREGGSGIRSCPQVLAAKLGQEGGKFGAALKESSDDFAAERVFHPDPQVLLPNTIWHLQLMAF